jgi:plasmid maintenance system killer protein
VQLKFENEELKNLAYDPAAQALKWAPEALRQFRRTIFLIRECVDENDLRHYKSLGLQRLKGKAVKRFSAAITVEYLLIFRLELLSESRTIVVIEAVDHH